MNLRPVLFVTGILLSVLASSMLLPMMADLYYGESDWKVFFFCSALTAFFSGALIISNRGETFDLNIRQAFLITSVGWLSIALFGALPFRFSEMDMSFTDAFFESMSGITTTGATVMTDLENTPRGILLWRAMLQWLGGIGIIVMALSVLPFLKVGGMQLFRTESSQNEKAMPRAANLSAAITLIYIALSALCCAFYMMAGLGTFDSVTHAMTTLATGGFSTHNESFGYFDNVSAEIIAISFMLLSGMPFVLLLKAIRGSPKSIFKDQQVQVYLSIALFSIFLMLAYMTFIHDEPFLSSLRMSAFNIVSVMTGTGYATEDYSLWGGFAISYMLFLMVVGGCAGSTTCGIKIFRFQVLYAVAVTQIKKLSHPNGVFIPHYNHLPLPQDAIMSVLSFFFLFAISFVMAVIGLSFVGLDFLTAISSAATALSNLGPALGNITGPAGTFSSIPDSAKWILSFCMIVGRLELFTVFVMLSPYFWKS